MTDGGLSFHRKARVSILLSYRFYPPSIRAVLDSEQPSNFLFACSISWIAYFRRIDAYVSFRSPPPLSLSLSVCVHLWNCSMQLETSHFYHERSSNRLETRKSQGVKGWWKSRSFPWCFILLGYFVWWNFVWNFVRLLGSRKYYPYAEISVNLCSVNGVSFICYYLSVRYSRIDS